MLEGVGFVVAIAAFGYILFWSARNEKARSIADQTGLLRMYDHAAAAADASASAGSAGARGRARGSRRGEERRRSRT
jgi:hypothetical protein